MISFLAKTEADTEDCARKLAKVARAGDFFALQGGLGAGKTFWTKAFARALQVEDEVASPTYTLICEYEATLQSGEKLPFFHLDLYRLDGEDDFEQIGGEECLSSGGICVVEWSEKIPSFLGGAILTRFSALADGSREISVSNDEFERRISASQRGLTR